MAEDAKEIIVKSEDDQEEDREDESSELGTSGSTNSLRRQSLVYSKELTNKMKKLPSSFGYEPSRVRTLDTRRGEGSPGTQ